MEISTSMPTIITIKGLVAQHPVALATVLLLLAIKAHLQVRLEMSLSLGRQPEQRQLPSIPGGVRGWGQASPSVASWHYLLNAFTLNACLIVLCSVIN